MNRREVIKGLGALSATGLMAFKSNFLFDDDGLSDFEFNGFDKTTSYQAGEELRIGIIGFGSRGQHLVRAAGFATENWQKNLQKSAKENPKDTRWADYLAQPSLNIKFTGICDLYDARVKLAAETCGSEAKIFASHQELLASPNIDAVIIATPDHWHAPMIIEATRKGKHVYVEKCFTRTAPEAVAVHKEVSGSNIKFQLGHQLRQTASYFAAKELITQGVLGKISLIQTNSNRNSANGAWVYNIPADASPKTIDWQQFVQGEHEKFDMDRFFRWRKYWDYGTGLLGDLMTHDFDAVNQILSLGIPASVVSSGGIYYWQDGREVPDVLQVVMEYPQRNLTYNYSATLSNQRYRPNIIMGNEATMQIGAKVEVFPDPGSKKYAEKLASGEFKTNTSIIEYNSNDTTDVDGISSATTKYFMQKGMMYTNKNGKRISPTYLHIREWLDSIRHGTPTSCDIEQAYVEAISTHMAAEAYKSGRRTFWDEGNKKFAF
jgi:predicted dehydrogenase